EGEWRLFVSDQSPRNTQTPPRGVLAGSPKVKLLQGQLKAEITQDAETATSSPRGKLIYRADRQVKAFDETMSLEDVEFAYDPFETAHRLRAVALLPTPRTDDFDSAPLISDGASLTGQVSSSDGLIDPPILWGFMPLTDGWAQLPVFNLTEQLLIDALPPAAAKPKSTSEMTASQSLFRGAAVFGTDSATLYRSNEGRPAWNLAVRDAASCTGTWTFEPEPLPSKESRLKNISLTLSGPQLSAEGLLNFATETPSAVDAIPTLDNWVGGLFGVALKTPIVNELDDPYPCPFLLSFKQFKVRSQPLEKSSARVAQIEESDWSYVENPRPHTGKVPPSRVPNSQATTLVGQDKELPLHVWLTALPASRYPIEKCWGVDPKKLEQPEEVKKARSALAWRRHPNHPCVHVLPLTQNSQPANHLSASRQLTPFHLPLKKISAAGEPSYLVPERWTFTSKTGEVLPSVPTTLQVVSELEARQRLVLAPLGLPGSALAMSKTVGAMGDPTNFANRFVYRHDLPLLDQPCALADVPRDDAAASVLVPPALGRAEFAAHWSTLEDKALLAEIDEAEAIVATTGNLLAIRGLMEPLLWHIKELKVELTGFPGRMTLSDKEDPSQQLILAGEGVDQDALRGIDGAFLPENQKLRLVDGTDPKSVTVTAGSMAAVIQGQQLRDQRGLLRGASTSTSTPTSALPPQLVVTPVQQLASELTTAMRLCSLRSSRTLKVGNDSWKFWFKGLPTQGSGASFKFDRKDTLPSAQLAQSPRRGVNDPTADGRDRGHLNGYEWRLGLKSDQPWLPIGALRFYPLSLESMTCDANGTIDSATFIGRLQLPAWNGTDGIAPREFVNHDTAVIVVFKDGKLDSVTRAPNDPDNGDPEILESACWPLIDSETDPGSPRLIWKQITLSASKDKLVLPASTYRIEYGRQQKIWSIIGATNLVFPLDGTSPAAMTIQSGLPDSAVVGIESVTLKLDLTTGKHQLTVPWIIRVGDRNRLQVEIKAKDQLLWTASSSAPEAWLSHRGQTHELDVVMPSILLDRGGVAVHWSQFKSPKPVPLQLLPGFELSQEPTACRGFAMLAFRHGVEITNNGSTWWSFDATGAYADILFDCLWSQPDAANIYRSSSGVIQAEFHSALATDRAANGTQSLRWPWEVNLSGMLEIANLISWPTKLDFSKLPKVTLPAVTDDPAGHWRHTINVLLSEQKLRGAQELSSKDDILTGSERDNCVFTLASKKVWSFVAPVEHRLEQLPESAKSERTLRWSTVQEVRLSHPLAFYRHLKDLLDAPPSESTLYPSRADLANAWIARPSHETLDGWHAVEMLKELKVLDGALSLQAFERTRLAELCKDAPADPIGEAQVLVVEASTPLFLRCAESPDRLASPLMSASGSKISGGTSVQSDFSHQPDPAKKDEWLFASIPFLGRLQDRQRDEITSTAPLFAADPVNGLLKLPKSDTPPILWRALAHRAGRGPDTVTPMTIDASETARFFRRLDPSSIADAWNRLLRVRDLPPAEAASLMLLPVTAAAESDAMIKLARPHALRRLLDPRRHSLPPYKLADDLKLLSSNPEQLVWTPASVAVLQGIFSPTIDADHPYAFLQFPLALSTLLNKQPAPPTQRLFAATLLPVPGGDEWNPYRLQPVTLAVSPLSHLSCDSWGASSKRQRLLTTAELVVFNAVGTRAEILATQLIHPRSEATNEDKGI
ncbi:MAG: hypothetical protein IAG10_17490, partial [Planctomycetaceae bacterium]|nr:hypothetical protein [Planctomycetaceae bacterium]